MTKNILLNTLLFLVIAFIITILEVLVFWIMFGEVAEFGRIADLWYVNIFFEYFPLFIILTILSFRTFKRYKNKESNKVKANLITILILIILYLLRYQILDLTI